MKVTLGNPRFEGAVTTIMVESGPNALNNVLGAVSLHFKDGDLPLWVETADEKLQADIKAHYNLKDDTDENK